VPFGGHSAKVEVAVEDEVEEMEQNREKRTCVRAKKLSTNVTRKKSGKTNKRRLTL